MQKYLRSCAKNSNDEIKLISTAHDLLGVVFPHYIFLQMNTWLCRHFRCAGGLQSAGLRFAATATLHSYYRKWLWSVTERDGLTSECSYGRFRSAWLSFVSLHPVDSSVFQCSLCGVSPEIVICDGITLSFQKRFRIGMKAKADEGDPLKGCRLVGFFRCRIWFTDFIWLLLIQPVNLIYERI